MKIWDTSELNMCFIECHYSCRFLTTQCRAVLEALYYNKISHVQLVVLAMVVDKICLFLSNWVSCFRRTNRSFRIKATVRIHCGDTAILWMGTYVSMSSINSKNLRQERWLGGGMGSTECRFYYLFLLKTQSPDSGRSPFWICTICDLLKAVVVCRFDFRYLPLRLCGVGQSVILLVCIE